MKNPKVQRVSENKIKCAFCEKPTGFSIEDFEPEKDLDDVYCSSECRYESETGNPGEEY